MAGDSSVFFQGCQELWVYPVFRLLWEIEGLLLADYVAQGAGEVKFDSQFMLVAELHLLR